MKRFNKNGFLVKHRVSKGTFVIELEKLHRVLSSAPRGGGLVRARSILNHEVQPNPLFPVEQGRLDRHGIRKWTDPARYLGQVASQIKATLPTVGLMTAVPMKQLVKNREES